MEENKNYNDSDEEEVINTITKYEGSSQER